jgi:hypothetical protein
MEAISEIFSQINSFLTALKINPMYVLLWIAAGYIQRVYLPSVVTVGKMKLNDVWKTFLLGSLFSVVYAILLRNVTDKATWVEFFASYLFATSMYEMFLKNLVNLILTKAQGIFTKKIDSV